jgi:hypothetical protein
MDVCNAKPIKYLLRLQNATGSLRKPKYPAKGASSIMSSNRSQELISPRLRSMHTLQ